MSAHTPPLPPKTTFQDRRRRAAEALGEGVLVLTAAPVQYTSRDTERPYAPDRELFYLTGLTEPETVAVLVGGDDPELVLFVRERDPQAELWAGPRLGPEAAEEQAAPDECHPLSELQDRLPGLLGRGDRIHYRLGRDGPVERAVLQALATARGRGARTGTGPRGVVDPGEVLDELRLRKDTHELEALRRACGVTVAGHRAGAAALKPG
ncbi:MAG: aminopeptidase P N-terminal domain-containing protein, partial [Longimicrobiales bacterium]|nr:aminopeptidase P N-terminal domain-containing protein [Longimicrobiales bacterium]